MTTLAERNKYYQNIYNAGTLCLKDTGFKLKSGDVSPFYINMKSCMSSVEHRDEINDFIKKKYDLHIKKMKREATKSNTLDELDELLDIKGIIGVPYGGIQFAMSLGERLKLPNLILRDKIKTHGLGTKNGKFVEGTYEIGDNVIVVEDVVSTGASCLEGIKNIEKTGLSVSLVVVIMNRDQGGVELIESKGYNVLVISNAVSYLETLLNLKMIEEYQYEAALHFINLKKTQYSKELNKELNPEILEKINKSDGKDNIYEQTEEEKEADRLALEKLKEEKSDLLEDKKSDDNEKEKNTEKEKERHIYPDIFQHKLRSSLLELMKVKKSCLCLSLDVNSWEKAKEIIEECGEYIVMVKTHVELFNDFNSETFGKEIKDLADKHKFFIMEDRKLADIDEVNWKEMMFGLFRPDDWANFITLQGLTSDSTLNMYVQKMSSGYPLNISPCVVTQMNTISSLIDTEYTKRTLDIIDKYDKELNGSLVSPILITQCLPSVKNRIKFTPGVCIDDDEIFVSQSDTMNKYRSIETAILYEKNHGIIVGRDIVHSENPKELSKKYANLSWNYFQESHPKLVEELELFIEELAEINRKLVDDTMDISDDKVSDDKK